MIPNDFKLALDSLNLQFVFSENIKVYEIIKDSTSDYPDAGMLLRRSEK